MKLNKIMLMGILLLILITVGAVSASENISETDTISTKDTSSESSSVSSTETTDTISVSETDKQINKYTNDISNIKTKKTLTETSVKSTDSKKNKDYENITIYISDKVVYPILSDSEIDYVCYIKDKKLNYLNGNITLIFKQKNFNPITAKNYNTYTTYDFSFNSDQKISGFWILNNDKIIIRKEITSEDINKQGLTVVNSTKNSYLYNKLFKGEDSKNTTLIMCPNTLFILNSLPLVNSTEEVEEVDEKEEEQVITTPPVVPYAVYTVTLKYIKYGAENGTKLSKKVSFLHDEVKLTSKYTPAPKKPIVTLSLKKVKVKKSAKKLVLKATIKVNKKFAKSKTVIFKFNGKKYKAKTNKRGVAKITIKKSVLKKLKVGKKIKYQVSYGGKTFTRTVKVKK